MNLLLIPGFMLDADLWRDVLPSLTSYGRVIHADTTQDTSIEAMAARALAGLKGPTLIIGFSMGGYVARMMAYRAPEQISGLILVATSSRGDDTPTRPVAAGGRGLSRRAVAAALHPDHRTELLIGRVQRMGERLGGAVFQRQAQMKRYSDTARLGDLSCPTLIVAGAQDQVRPMVDSQTMHGRIPHSVMTAIEHTGHLIPLEQPESFMRAMRPWCETVRP